MSANTVNHPVVSREEWIVASKDLLAREKEFTRERDRLSAARRDLPWVKIDKDYSFETPNGRQSLHEMFGGNSQLIVYHFMLAPNDDHLCPGCCFLSDHIDAANQHLPHHNVTLLAVSRAPLAQIEKVRERMGWKFQWVSSFGSDFNYDFHVTLDRKVTPPEYNLRPSNFGGGSQELPGISVFIKSEQGEVFHTYSSYARGGDLLIGTYNYLDLTPLGRDESAAMDWVRHHDDYGDAPAAASCCHQSDRR